MTGNESAELPGYLDCGAVLAEFEPVCAMDDVEPEAETPREAVSMESGDRDVVPNTRGTSR